MAIDKTSLDYSRTPDFDYIAESSLRDKWPVRSRPSGFGNIPYGYELKGGDPRSLVPVMELVILIEQALDQLDRGSSLREVALWLSHSSGKSISHAGLSKIWRRQRGDQPSFRKEKTERIQKALQPKTKEEKKIKITNLRAAAEKRKITAAHKRLKKLQESKEEIPVKMTFDYVELEESSEIDESEVAFRPNPGPQTEFLAAPEQEVLYGGAAGGGKSYALLADFLRQADNPNHQGLLLRRTNDELRELIRNSLTMYLAVYPKARWNQQRSEWTFPSGAKLWISYLEQDKDVLRYQGQSFTWVGFDELTQYSTPYAWDYLRTRLRSADPTIELTQRGTTNPGGPGHGWVKRYFIDPAAENKPFIPQDVDGKDIVFEAFHKEVIEGRRKVGEPMFLRRFIPAKLKDNPYLYEDGRYETNLLSQGENVRRQLLEGDWGVAEGAAFPEFRKHLHTCEPFDIPSSWRRFRSCDYGYTSYSAVHWYAIDPSFDTLYVYRELYVSKKTGVELAPLILQQEARENVAYGVLDSSCWHNRGQTGPTIAEEMIRSGCRWRPADRGPTSRVNGRQRLHNLLRVEEGIGRPGIVFFNNCRQIIADLPVIPTDPDGGDDIDVRYTSDHAYDSIRYGIQSRPQSRSPFGDSYSMTPSAGGSSFSDSRFGY